MAYIKKNWAVAEYVADTWTAVVSETATLASIIISNTTAADITISLRVAGVLILPGVIFPKASSYCIDLNSLNITSGQVLEFKAGAGVNVLASGVTDA